MLGMGGRGIGMIGDTLLGGFCWVRDGLFGCSFVGLSLFGKDKRERLGGVVYSRHASHGGLRCRRLGQCLE
jgi:hypothetical protein